MYQNDIDAEHKEFKKLGYTNLKAFVIIRRYICEIKLEKHYIETFNSSGMLGFRGKCLQSLGSFDEKKNANSFFFF